MNNGSSIKFGVLIVALLSLVITYNAMAEVSGRPNIVLIVADYMGYSDIGPYGATDIRTPSLDSLAKDGLRFSNYYSASPVCGPSRAALLSGFYPARVGMETNIGRGKGGLLSSDSTLVSELKAANYRTAMIGKWHLGQGPELSPLSHGFDRFFGFHSWTIGYHNHLTISGDPGLFRGDELVDEDGYLTDIFSNEATQFIEESSGNPFFLYLAYNTALPPYQGPDLPESQWSEGWDVNEASRDDYIKMVEAMDGGIGKVLTKLDELKQTEDTLVIFTYDHGGRNLTRSNPLFHGFATLWEGGIRVPLLIKWPGRFSAGQDIERPTIAMDLTATMLAAAGRNIGPLELDGSSLLPLQQRGASVEAKTLFWRFNTQGGSMKAVRHDNWKYVIDGGSQFLFDVDSDPGERKNLFSEQTDRANKLRGALMEWEQTMESPESE